MHVETYPRVASRHPNSKKKHNTVRQVLCEVARVPRFSRHIEHSAKPELIFGEDPLCYLDLLEQAAEGRKDASGKKLRKDTHVLLGIVASYPDKTETDESKLCKWVQANVQFFLKRFNCIKSIVRHRDEGYPHLHIIGHMYGENVKAVHPGYAAQARARTEKELRRWEAQAAYTSAMQALQDEYFNQVSREFGFLRISESPKPRRTKAQLRREKAVAKKQEAERERQRANEREREQTEMAAHSEKRRSDKIFRKAAAVAREIAASREGPEVRNLPISGRRTPHK